MSDRPGRTDRGWRLGLVAAFAVTQWGYHLLGVRFDVSPLGEYLQYLDPVLLRTRLLQSSFYLHMQPPLFNLFLGAVLEAFPAHSTLAFELAFLAFGLALSLALFELMRRLDVPAPLGAAITVACFASPAFVLHEHFLFYPLPLAAALTLSALLLARFLDRGRARDGVGFSLCVAAACATWGVFHLLYFVVILAGVILRHPQRRRALLRSAAIPMLLVVALYAKNSVVFGKFGASTWLGMNLWMVATDGLTPEQLAERHAAGRVSELSVLGPFRPVIDYPERYRSVRGHEDVVALRQELKSTGHGNMNHLGYVALGDDFMREATRIVRDDPKRYVRGVMHAWFVYFESTSYFKPFRQNAQAIGPLHRGWERVCFGALDRGVRVGGQAKPVWLVLLIGLPVVLALGLGLALRRPETSGLDATQRTVMLYLAWNIGFIAAVSNLLQVGENNRFRFLTDPLSLALLGVLLARARRRAAPGSPAAPPRRA